MCEDNNTTNSKKGKRLEYIDIKVLAKRKELFIK